MVKKQKFSDRLGDQRKPMRGYLSRALKKSENTLNN